MERFNKANIRQCSVSIKQTLENGAFP